MEQRTIIVAILHQFHEIVTVDGVSSYRRTTISPNIVCIFTFISVLFVYIVFRAHIIVEGFEFLKGQVLHGMLNNPYQLFTTVLL